MTFQKNLVPHNEKTSEAPSTMKEREREREREGERERETFDANEA